MRSIGHMFPLVHSFGCSDLAMCFHEQHTHEHLSFPFTLCSDSSVVAWVLSGLCYIAHIVQQTGATGGKVVSHWAPVWCQLLHIHQESLWWTLALTNNSAYPITPPPPHTFITIIWKCRGYEVKGIEIWVSFLPSCVLTACWRPTLGPNRPITCWVNTST